MPKSLHPNLEAISFVFMPNCSQHFRLTNSSSEKFFFFPMAVWRRNFAEKMLCEDALSLGDCCRLTNICTVMSHITRQTENESSFLTMKTTVRNVVCVKSYIIFKKGEFWPGDLTFWRPLQVLKIIYSCDFAKIIIQKLRK